MGRDFSAQGPPIRSWAIASPDLRRNQIFHWAEDTNTLLPKAHRVDEEWGHPPLLLSDGHGSALGSVAPSRAGVRTQKCMSPRVGSGENFFFWKKLRLDAGEESLKTRPCRPLYGPTGMVASQSVRVSAQSSPRWRSPHRCSFGFIKVFPQHWDLSPVCLQVYGLPQRH